MSTVNNGPQIVRSGLVLDLDASLVSSYSAIAVYKVECYSSYNGGVRSANYTVQYSDDNSTWTTAFTGVMSNNSTCGIITGTNRNDSNYSKHRYWRYVEGSTVVGHHPRVSRIDFITKSGAVYNLITSTTDNCSDSGIYIIGTQTKDFGGTTWRDVSGNNINTTLINGPVFNNANGGSIVFDGTNDAANATTSIINRSDGQEITVACWIKPSRTSGQYSVFCTNRSNDTSTYNWIFYQHTTDGAIAFHGDNQNKSSYIPTINTWVNVTATVTAASLLTLYVNGSSNYTVAGYTYGNGTPSILGIGADPQGQEAFQGNMAQVLIYTRALTASEISQNYEATKTRFGL